MNKIDTNADYMSIIYKFVIDKNTEKKSIYEILIDDYKKFINSDKYNFYMEDGSINDKWIDNTDWISEYCSELSDEEKNEIFTTYGIYKITTSLDDIAHFYGFTSYDEMLEDYDDKDFVEYNILSYIAMTEILKDYFIDDDK